MTSPAGWSSKILGYEFNTPGLLERALTHKSKSARNNERLEFLGDAVLGMVIAEDLFRREEQAAEGVLSRLRATLVRRECLGEIAGEIGLSAHLILGGGETRSGGHQRRSINGDALEALFGAIYLDGGFSAARDVILRLYAHRLDNLPPPDQLKDPKTLLQEYLQGRGLNVPTYTVVAETGPDHARQFKVECEIAALDICTLGKAGSRRDAEQKAAAAALETAEEADG